MELVQNQLYPAIANTTDVSDLMERGGPWLAGQLPVAIGASEREVLPTPALVNYAKNRWIRSRRARDELTDLRDELAKIIELLETDVTG